MNRITLLTGGARSGKSRRALTLAEGYEKKIFIATAEAFDEEMKARIAAHQKERGQDWETVEAPIALSDAISASEQRAEFIVVDCLTVWMANLQHAFADDEQAMDWRVEALLDTLQNASANIVLVTNEVGMGIVPVDAETRHYRDKLGYLNRKIALIASRVELLVCGIPIKIKGDR